MRPLHDGEGCEHHSAHPTGRMPTQGYTQGVCLHSTVLLETLRRVSQHSASRSSQENAWESWVLAYCGILRSDWQKGGHFLGVMGKVPRWIKGGRQSRPANRSVVSLEQGPLEGLAG